MTDILSSSSSSSTETTDNNSKLLLKYLDSFFYNQILKGIIKSTEEGEGGDELFVNVTENDAINVWKDWRQRLIHKHFGLSTFFITQNGAAKGGIRFGPTIIDLIQSNKVCNCYNSL